MSEGKANWGSGGPGTGGARPGGSNTGGRNTGGGNTGGGGSSAAVVIVVVLVLLMLPCAAGLLLLGGALFVARQAAPRPIPLPPVAGANAPLPVPPVIPGNAAIPDSATITVSTMTWSTNLFDDAANVLTLAKYEQIQPGMTYDQAIAILAVPENRQPPDMKYVGPQSDVELKWFGGPGDAQSLTIQMKGKIVTGKAQTGLK